LKKADRFLEHSLGSCFELETEILIAEKINYGNSELRKSLLTQIDEEQR